MCINTECDQTTEEAIYSGTRSDLVSQNIAEILKLPLSTVEESLFMTYDEPTGYARNMTRNVEYKLNTGNYFFLQEPFGIPDQPNPIVAKIDCFM